MHPCVDLPHPTLLSSLQRFASPRDVDSWHPKVIGSAVYPTLALLNHSCDPNIAKYYLR
jgi:hypothetical protein